MSEFGWDGRLVDVSEPLRRRNLRLPEREDSCLRAWMELADQRRKVRRRHDLQERWGVWLVLWTGFLATATTALICLLIYGWPE